MGTQNALDAAGSYAEDAHNAEDAELASYHDDDKPLPAVLVPCGKSKIFVDTGLIQRIEKGLIGYVSTK